MKKIRILTLIGDYNIGNKLQNYALVKSISKLGKYDVATLWNINIIKHLKRTLNYFFSKDKRRRKLIIFSKKYTKEKYFFRSEKANYIIGSDQVWNYNFADLDWFFGNKLNCKSLNSYAASFGIDSIPDKYVEIYKKGLSKFKNISVREDAGKIIVNSISNKEAEVLIDPTMMLTAEEWDMVSTKPKQLDKITNKKYIFNYFLGNLSEQIKKEIEKIAKENNCYIINFLDKSDKFYNCGPSEFLYLEKHAFLVCTDSFHSSVFAFIFNRPFVVFDRNEKNMNNMGSRLETLINKFKLDNRKYNGKYITKDNLKHNYENGYKILENERKTSEKFLKKILETERSN